MDDWLSHLRKSLGETSENEINNTPFTEFEAQWGGMLNKFAGWNDFGMEREDILQELRIVLYRAQQQYDPQRGVKLSTYLYRAFLNRTKKMRDRALGKTVKRQVPFSTMSTLEGLDMLDQEDILDETIATSQLNDDGTRLAKLIIDGYGWKEWLSKMTPKAINTGLADIKRQLKGATGETRAVYS